MPGSIKVDSTSMNRGFLPKNSNLANPKATIEQVSNVPTVARTETITLFKK